MGDNRRVESSEKWWDDNKRCVHVDPVSGLRCVRVHLSAASRICQLPHEFTGQPQAPDAWWAGLKPEARAWVYNTALNTAIDLAMETPLPPLNGGSPPDADSAVTAKGEQSFTEAEGLHLNPSLDMP
jgi:hypothetical protein